MLKVSILKLKRVVICQYMPALKFLIFVLEAFIPVLQTFPFSLNAQLASPCTKRKTYCQF